MPSNTDHDPLTRVIIRGREKSLTLSNRLIGLINLAEDVDVPQVAQWKYALTAVKAELAAADAHLHGKSICFGCYGATVEDHHLCTECADLIFAGIRL